MTTTHEDTDQARRLACEHEAAHAVVAAELGLTVGRVALGADGSGYTNISHTDPDTKAVVLIAPTVWVDFLRHRQYPHGDTRGCSNDVARLRASTSAFGIRIAGDRAREILQRKASTVLALAAWLEVDGAVDYETWSAQLSPVATPQAK